MHEDVGGGITEARGTVGGSEGTVNQITHQLGLLGSRPSMAGDEVTWDLGASFWRTLSARLKTLS